MIRRLRECLPTQRRLIQLYAALLYNAQLKGFITGDIYTGPLKAMCVPGLNCYSCPGATGAYPLGALQNALASSGNRAPVYVLGILLLFGLTLGRTICGCLCPMGLLQELLFKIPTPKVKKGRLTRALSWVKYVVLAGCVVILPLWYALQKYPGPAFCKYICPAGPLEGAVGLLSNPVHADKFSMLGLLFTRKFVILVALALLCVFVYRAFCRFLCPLGAIYGMFSRLAVIGVKVDAKACTDCGRCVSVCRMDIRRVGDHECIHCGECIGECPAKAITFRAGKYVLHGPQVANASADDAKKARRVRRTAWAAALLLLGGILLAVNLPLRPADDPVSETVVDGLPVGSSVGMRAPDFTLPRVGGGELTLSDYRGKVVFVNLWATWCTPCCQELPYFDELLAAYPGEVAVVAVHSPLVTDDVADYLSGFDYRFDFVLDGSGDVFEAFGASAMLPQTIVISPEGVIVSNAVGSVTPASLEALLQQARAGEEAAPTPPPTSAPTGTPAPTAAPPRKPLPGFGR